MNSYIPTIGLEIHAELSTQTKMFCVSQNDSNEKRPNVNICPVCMAHPGTLPTVNKEAVRQVLRVGCAVNGTLADYSEFDRKNYFYPDIPKAYQLSQYEFPLVSGGQLQDVHLTRIHLEEDTARSSHIADEHTSYVDFNRAGVPLMELVTEPDIHSAAQAASFGRELQLLLRTLGASYAHMEKGEMRVEVNLSLAKAGEPLGTKVEVKNLNSFRAVERAIEYEVQRQTELLEKGEQVIQETRGWDENKGITFSQRVKEEAADYRYFPDPDIPKLKISELPEFARDVLIESLPELPAAKRLRLKSEHDISDEAVQAYVHDATLEAFFNAVIVGFKEGDDTQKKIQLASNYITNNLVAQSTGTEEHVADIVDPVAFREVVELNYAGEISSNGAVELIGFLTSSKSSDMRATAQEKGLLLQNDVGALTQLVDTVLGEHSDAVAQYKEGKEQALQFLVGQCMRASRGTGNPEKIKEILLQKLKN